MARSTEGNDLKHATLFDCWISAKHEVRKDSIERKLRDEFYLGGVRNDGLIQFFRLLCLKFDVLWKKYHRLKKDVLKYEGVFLSSAVVLPRDCFPKKSNDGVCVQEPVNPKARGRPLKNFSECSRKTWKHRIESLTANYSAEELKFAAGVSEQTTAPEQVKRSQNIVPVTVKQVIESSEEGLNIAGVESNLVKLVGIVRSIQSSSVKSVYRFEDSTGAISLVDYVKDEGDASQKDVQVIENQYHRAVGTVRTAAGEKHILVIDLQPLTDLKEITSHMLEIIYVSLKSEEYEKMGDMEVKREPMSYNGDMSSNNAGQNPNNYYNDSSNTNSLNFNPTQQKVFSVIQQSQEDNGITPQDIYDALPQKMPMKDISSVLEWLVNEGHVYTAIDDNHFRSTY